MNRKLIYTLIFVAVAIPMAVMAAYTDEIILHVDTGNMIQNGAGYQVVSDEGDYIPITYPPQILYNSDVNLRDGLVAYWDMDETSGVRYDSHAGNNLTDNNTVGYTTTGKIGIGAYSIETNNEYLSISMNDVYTMVISGWFFGNAGNPIDITSDYGSIQIVANSDTIQATFMESYNEIECELTHSEYPVNLNEWYYFVFEIDRSVPSINLWFNGEHIIEITSESCTGIPNKSNYSMSFARYGNIYADELTIYNRLLSTGEISLLYNAGAGIGYDDFAPSYDLDDQTGLISGNTTWSARLLWTPAYSATVDWPTSGATLFDTRGSSDSERVRLSFDESDNAYHVYINGADRLTSPEQTFTAGIEQDVVVSLSFNADEYALYVNGIVTDTDTTILGAPGVSDWWIGRYYSGTTTANAEYSELTIFDEYLDPVDVADMYGESMTRHEIGGVDDLTEALVSYWQMEETSGTRADSWGDNDLTDNNTVTYATGVISNAAQMDAANAEYLSHSNNTSLDTGNIDFTVFGFAYMDTLTNTGIIERSGEYSLRYDTEIGRFAFSVNDTTCTTATTVYATGSPVVTGTWYGVIGWHDLSNGDLGIRVDHDEYIIPYVDGVCDSSGTGNVFWVGRSDAGYHDGRIDEVAFWKRVLNPTERSYVVKGYFNDMRPGSVAQNPTIYMPFISRNHQSDAIITTPTPFPYVTPTPESPFIGIDYGGDTSWTEWAKTIEDFFAPLFINIDAAESGVEELRSDVCGAGFEEGAGFLPGEYSTPTEASLGEDPTILDVAYSFGVALGRPFSWIRALYSWLPTVNSEYNVAGINFFVMLVYFLTGGIVWIAFVIIVTYSSYFIRSVIDFAIKLYELIPFKST